MASVTKMTEGALYNQLRHNTREINQSSNPDIDKERTLRNYSLTPNSAADAKSCMEYYRKRKQELYVYNRPDVKCAASWVITMPKEIVDLEEQKTFFKCCHMFLQEKYGKDNIIQSVVHYDEGKMVLKRHKHSKEPILKDGQLQWEKMCGQAHLHFVFIPVVKIDHDSLKGKKHHAELENYEYKICANEVLTKTALKKFHGELSEYLIRNGIDAKVMSGITKSQGGNRTVKEIKHDTERNLEIDISCDFEHSIK